VKILLLVDSYLPSTKSSATLIHDLALEFAARGHHPSVVAPNSEARADVEVTSEGSVEVVRVRTGRMKGAARWLRGVNEARLSSRVWGACRHYFRSRSFDFIVFYSPTIFFGSLVSRLKKLYGCRSYLILRDIFPQWAVDAGVMGKGLPYWYFKRKEYAQYDAADHIGVQSPANLEYFKERGLTGRYRLEVLFNWMKIGPVTVPRSDLRSRWGCEAKLLLFYGGNIGVSQDCDNLIRLASGLQTAAPQAHVMLLGEGTEVGRLRRRIQEYGLRNVSIEGPLPQAQYLEAVRSADVGLLTLDGRLRTQNFPGKLLSYMHEARPILASINPGNDLKEILEGVGAGLVCRNGDDGVFLECALKLIRDEALRASMGDASRKLLEDRFSVSIAAEQILGAGARPYAP
jgi:O26-antigen biosynthesis N-acetyl-L-fucosamine transferase